MNRSFLLTAILFALISGAKGEGSLPDPGKYQTTINGNIRVELLAVSNAYWEFVWQRETKPAQVNNREAEYWWKPGGELLSPAPFQRAGMSSGFHFDYALRISGVDGDYSVVAADSDREAFNQLYITEMNTLDGKPVPNVHIIAVPRSSRSQADKAALRVGIAYGPWMTLETWAVDNWPEWVSEPESHTFGSNCGALIEPRADASGNLEVDLAHCLVKQQVRLLATDQLGKEYVAQMRDRGDGAGISRRLCKFKGLTLNNLKSIDVQVRNYEWGTIPDINISPDHVKPYKNK